MDRSELLEKLRQLQNGTLRLGERDPEIQHSQADDLLLEFIGDEEVSAVYEAIPRWYS